MRRPLLVTLVVLTALVACGGDDDTAEGNETTSTSAAVSTTAPAADASEGEEGYRPASNVDEHSAIGRDAAEMRRAMEPATRGEEVDWTAVADPFEQGGNSRAGDGSFRTLAGLMEGSVAIPTIRAAIEGTGELAEASDAVRRQWVDKGVSVLLAEKVIEELGRARAKIEEGNLTPPATGAVHNVDEAWAFFTAEGEGPAATADKRAADFEREGQVREPVLEALTRAQTASLDGDLEAFDAATSETQEALDYIFYLATYKYLDHDDEVGKAEGQAFYQGISPRVEAADAEAHQSILDALESGDTAAGRDALHTPAVMTALGVSAEEQVSA